MTPGLPTERRAGGAARMLARSLLLAASLIGIGCEPPEPPPPAVAQQAGEQDEPPATDQPQVAPREPAEAASCADCAASSAVTRGECHDLWLACQTPEDAPTLACITARRCLDLADVEQGYLCLAGCGHTAIEGISPPIDRFVSCAYCACSLGQGACRPWVQFLDDRLAGGACP